MGGARVAAIRLLSKFVAFQANLQREDLWQEAALLDRLLYKNRSQHRGSHHFRRLLEVRSDAITIPLAHPGRRRAVNHFGAVHSCD